MSTALITGASSGIGEGFARRLATIGYDVVLVARDVDRLTKLSAELRESWRVEVEVLPADLATDDGCRDVENRVADASNPIDMVINNAGFGLGISVVASDIEAEERMLRVMVRAPMRITKAALPGMLERGRGDLIIVASTAGLVSHNSYGATKAWGIRFSQALSVKLTGTGVRVVDDCLRDLQRGKTISVPSKRYKIIVAIGKLLPTSVVSKVTGLRRSAPVGATSVR
jgi:short-subunit dehydrogenase